MRHPDLFIVGAGPVGCVIAERAATVQGWTSLLIDRRPHLAGNCYDRTHSSGVWIHEYGPHYFRTEKQELLDYLSAFTDWIPGNYQVKSSVRGRLYSFPINLTTLEMFFNRPFTPEQAKAHLEKVRERIPEPKNSEEFVLAKVGRDLYESFYLGYTLKQWDRHPRDLDPSVCGRIPIRFNRDESYVNQEFKVTPAKGFTQLFSKMVNNPRIELQLGTDFREIRQTVAPRVATVYCGPVDEYFDYRLGRLPWRSLRFDVVTHDQEFVQPCVQINYPNENSYTRTVEIKHVTRQKIPNTAISYEYSQSLGDRYYPVPAAENRALYQRYEALALREQRNHRTYFAGRLATYRYINTDEAIESGLATFEKIRQDQAYGQALGGDAGIQRAGGDSARGRRMDSGA